MKNNQDVVYKWVDSLFSTPHKVYPIAGDAGARNYYRVETESKNYVVMQSAIDKSWQKFLTMSDIFEKHGINVPQRIEINGKEGLILLTDFGEKQYLSELNHQTADKLYHDAFKTLIQIQKINYRKYPSLIRFDEQYIENQLLEMFQGWYLENYLKIKTSSFAEELKENVSWLAREIDLLPKVLVHYDYHSRNLMYISNNSPGVIDYQDALIGPITYDLVSLLQDCYIQWPRSWVELWVDSFRKMLIKEKIISSISFGIFLRAFDLVGLQRHLKNLGVFARLYLRDNKKQYVPHMPTILSNILIICNSHSELNTFHDFLQNHLFSNLPSTTTKTTIENFKKVSV